MISKQLTKILGGRTLGMLIVALAVLGLASCSEYGAWDLLNGGDGSTVSSKDGLPNDAWADPALTYRVRLVFDASSTAENLTDFPLLVSLDSSRVDYSSFHNGSQTLRFYDAGDGAPELYYEVEEWNASGESFVWVRVPQIDAGATTDYIWMYWSDADVASSSYADAGQVWSDYTLVYHLGESGTTFTDSAGTSDGTASASATPEPGVIGDAFRSSRSGTKRWIDTNHVVNMNDYTVEVWVRGDAAPATTSEPNGPFMAHYSLNIAWDHNNTSYVGNFHFNDGGWTPMDQGELLGVTWYYLAVTADSAASVIRSYQDGTFVAETGPGVYDGDFNTTSDTAKIGDDIGGTAQPMEGLIDEVRLQPAVRSADWIATQHRSMIDSLLTYMGPEAF